MDHVEGRRRAEGTASQRNGGAVMCSGVLGNAKVAKAERLKTEKLKDGRLGMMAGLMKFFSFGRAARLHDLTGERSLHVVRAGALTHLCSGSRAVQRADWLRLSMEGRGA